MDVAKEIIESANFFQMLADRWQDEHEYEDASDYQKVFEEKFPKLKVDKVRSSTKYLSFDIHHVDEPKRKFQFKTTARAVNLLEFT